MLYHCNEPLSATRTDGRSSCMPGACYSHHYSFIFFFGGHSVYFHTPHTHSNTFAIEWLWLLFLVFACSRCLRKARGCLNMSPSVFQLGDLLIKPIQRIQKYHLLVKKILSYSEHANCAPHVIASLREAVECTDIIPKNANNMMDVGRLQGFAVRTFYIVLKLFCKIFQPMRFFSYLESKANLALLFI